MGEDSKYCKILELAIEREVQAYLAYTALAGRMVHKGMRNLFMAMAAEELQHKSNLELELMKLGKSVPDCPINSDVNKANATVGGGEELDMDYKDAISLAIKKEASAYELYSELAVTSDDARARHMFFEMAEQEMKHKIRFEEEYEHIIKDEM